MFSSQMDGYPALLAKLGFEFDNAGDVGSIPGVDEVPREGNGNPFLYSCLEKPMDRGATAHSVAKSQT